MSGGDCEINCVIDVMPKTRGQPSCPILQQIMFYKLVIRNAIMQFYNACIALLLIRQKVYVMPL